MSNLLNYTTKRVLTLDKVDGISIREHKKLKDSGINLKVLAEKFDTHFKAARDVFFMEICIKEIYL